MTKQTALEFISSFRANRNRGSLDRMRELIRSAGLLEMLGGPNGPRYFHITGTNGKGSVTAYVESLLRAAGRRTGAYFSPYVFEVNERIQVGGAPISDDLFCELVEQLYPVAQKMGETVFGAPNEFEFKTLMGFGAWHRWQSTDIALEVGIGGRLDSTNVVNPVACAIVSVGMDHMAILGPTLAHIAREKAGIIKPGVPIVVGDLPKSAERVVDEIAQEKGSPLWKLGREFRIEKHRRGWRIETPLGVCEGIEPGIRGVHQPANAAVAIAMVQAAGVNLSVQHTRLAVRRTRLAGRFQVIEVEGKTVVLDGAHNEPSARALRLSLNEEFRNREVVAIVAMLKGHDPKRFFKALGSPLHKVFLTQVNFHRSVPAENLRQFAQTCENLVVERDAPTALSRALESLGDDQILVLTGSFYLLGDLYSQLEPWLKVAKTEPAQEPAETAG